MAYSKSQVLQQLTATLEQISESLQYYQDFKTHLESSFPQPSVDLPLNSAQYRSEVTRYCGLLDHTNKAIESALNQREDINFHIKVLEQWQ